MEKILDHYETLRHLHPDAGSKALRLIESIEADLQPMLGRHPDIGRPVQLSVTISESEQSWLQRLAPLTAARRLQAREWLLGDFWILYYRTASAVYLVSARHEREAEYH
ncbi:MAG: hypothetical protein EXR28_14310 [Betaproteobacteria bacterium]|nr:hypothetical protein [Betaproteobacteria bacterium]